MKTNRKTAARLARLENALSAAYVRKFTCQSCDPTYDAQRNLQGRTHYVDSDTLKGFQAKILNSGHSKDGLLYWLVESVQSRPDHGGYTRRAIVFDLFGSIVNERADMAETQGQWFKETRKAEDSAFAFLASFDAPAHTSAKMADKARRAILEAKRTLAALSGRRVK